MAKQIIYGEEARKALLGGINKLASLFSLNDFDIVDHEFIV